MLRLRARWTNKSRLVGKTWTENWAGFTKLLTSHGVCHFSSLSPSKPPSRLSSTLGQTLTRNSSTYTRYNYVNVPIESFHMKQNCEYFKSKYTHWQLFNLRGNCTKDCCFNVSNSFGPVLVCTKLCWRNKIMHTFIFLHCHIPAKHARTHARTHTPN